MNTNEAMIQAIEALWPELPALVGSDWPRFEAQVEPLLAQAKADPANAAVPLAQIMALFVQHRDAHIRLIFAMDKLITAAEQASIKGVTYGGATLEASASPPAAEQPVSCTGKEIHSHRCEYHRPREAKSSGNRRRSMAGDITASKRQPDQSHQR